MKIYYFGNFSFAAGNAATQRALSVSNSFVNLDYKVFIYGLNNTMSSIINTRPVKCHKKNIEMYESCYPRSLVAWIFFILNLKYEINIIRQYSKPHIVICYDYPSYKLWKINKFCIKNDIICIADITEWYDPSTRDFPWNYLVRFDTYFRMRWVVPKLNRVICVSKALYQFYAPKVAQCAYIPSSVDKCDSKWINIKSRNQKSSITFGYIGFPGLKWEKDKIDWLVQIICELNDEGFVCNLELAGFSKSEFEKKYSQLCLFNHYQSSINFHGILNHEEGIDLIKKLDYSVIIREDKISTRFGFPTKLAESFACGTPVISTPSSNIADYIINGKNGFLSADFSFDSIKNTLKNSFSVSKSQYTSMRSFAETDNRLDYRQFTSDLRRLVGLA